MDKLPPVSYIRMVDIWLISVQLVPFVLVVITTAKELFIDTTETNHHGKMREVGSKEQEKEVLRAMRIEKMLSFTGIQSFILSSNFLNYTL